MRLRMCAVAAVAGVLAGAFPVLAFGRGAAGPTPQIVDPAGDANYVNGQGAVAAGPNPSTSPADLSFADILSVTFATTHSSQSIARLRGRYRAGGLAPAGFTVTMTLASPPTAMPGVLYRVSVATDSCAQVFFEYSIALNGSPAGQLRCASLQSSTPIALTSVTVKGDSIVWTVPGNAFPPGQALFKLDAQTRNNVSTPARTVNSPQIDEGSSAATYTVGQ